MRISANSALSGGILCGLFAVAAAAMELSFCIRCQRPPRALGRRLKRAEVIYVRQEPKRMAASDTLDVLEEHQTAAVIAMKRSHVPRLMERFRGCRCSVIC